MSTGYCAFCEWKGPLTLLLDHVEGVHGAAAVSATSSEPESQQRESPHGAASPDASGSLGAAVSPTPEEAAATIREALAYTASTLRGMQSDADVTRKIDLTPEIEDCERGLAALDVLVAALRDARRERDQAEARADDLYEQNWPWEWVVATKEKERRQQAERERDQARDALDGLIESLTGEGAIETHPIHEAVAKAIAALGGAAEDGAA